MIIYARPEKYSRLIFLQDFSSRLGIVKPGHELVEQGGRTKYSLSLSPNNVERIIEKLQELCIRGS